MTLVSYAQNYEDIMLWRALGHVRKGFFIDVGAAWPVQDSVTRLFKDHGWRGINVEPNPDLHEQLVADRPDDINLAVAVSDERSTLDMDIVSDTGLSTLSDEIGGLYRTQGRQVVSVTVDVVTLADLWTEHVPAEQTVHFLKVDVEGYEAQVIAGADWHNHRPWVVVVEATRPTSQVASHESWEAHVLDAGYGFAYADGINRFYVAREHSELMPAFEYPPNVFDGFVLTAQDVAERRAATMEVRAIEAEQRADIAADSTARSEARASWLQSELDAAGRRVEIALRAEAELHRVNGALDALLGERERALASTTAQLHAALHHATEAHNLTQHLQAEVQRLQAEMQRLQFESDEVRDEAHRLFAVVTALDHHIADMYASSSWRFAKPVRALGTLVRSPRQFATRIVRPLARARPHDGPPLAPASFAASTAEPEQLLVVHDVPSHVAEAGSDLSGVANEVLEWLVAARTQTESDR